MNEAIRGICWLSQSENLFLPWLNSLELCLMLISMECFASRPGQVPYTAMAWHSTVAYRYRHMLLCHEMSTFDLTISQLLWWNFHFSIIWWFIILYTVWVCLPFLLHEIDKFHSVEQCTKRVYGICMKCIFISCRWCFDVELVYLCKHLSIPMIEVSVNWSEIPGSKVRLTSIIHMLFELILIRLGYGLGIWKIHTWYVYHLLKGG